MTVRDLLKGSLRLIGAIATGETPSNEELQDGLSALNSMLSGWSTEKLMVFAKIREEFSLVSGTQSYTIGSSGTFNTTKPQEIEEAKIEDQSVSPTVEYPVRILNMQEWAAIHTKDFQANIPTSLYREVGAALDTLYMYPKPSAANKLVLYSWKPFSSLATLDTSLSFPPGYERAVRYNLAVEWAPEFGKQFGPETKVGQIADESKENIKRMNITPSYLGVDSALTGGRPYNIHTGG